MIILPAAKVKCNFVLTDDTFYLQKFKEGPSGALQMPQQRHALFHLVARANRELATKYSHRMKGVDFFSHVLLDFQESVTSPAQQGADGDKAGDQRRLGTDTTATAQNLEKGNAAQSKETGVVFSALHLYCLLWPTCPVYCFVAASNFWCSPAIAEILSIWIACKRKRWAFNDI